LRSPDKVGFRTLQGSNKIFVHNLSTNSIAQPWDNLWVICGWIRNVTKDGVDSHFLGFYMSQWVPIEM
jgi:hypothetical protein